MLNQLTDAAPFPIMDDMKTVRDTYSQEMGTATNPDSYSSSSGLVGGLASSVVTGLENQSSFDNVDGYAKEHCGQEIFGTSPQRQ